MPAKKGNRAASKTDRPKSARSNGRVKSVSDSSSQIVKEAASLLDDELAAGILAAKQMQKRFRSERRVDPADFKEAVQQLQTQAHEVVNQFSSKISEASSRENVELLQRLVNNSHDLLDLTVELLNTGAELADQLAQSNLQKKDAKPK
ncbi:MAG TPA: hypothetical protein VJ306_04090 [Pyrinomonadaceae bacterium]|jgi:hypothetical protein|nr:hypothetical protein [Pyrinomonadaceae bacterium]